MTKRCASHAPLPVGTNQSCYRQYGWADAVFVMVWARPAHRDTDSICLRMKMSRWSRRVARHQPPREPFKAFFEGHIVAGKMEWDRAPSGAILQASIAQDVEGRSIFRIAQRIMQR